MRGEGLGSEALLPKGVPRKLEISLYRSFTHPEEQRDPSSRDAPLVETQDFLPPA